MDVKNTLLKSAWEGVSKEKNKESELKNNVYSTYQNLWYTAKEGLKGKFIALNAHIRKKISFKCITWLLALRHLGRKKQTIFERIAEFIEGENRKIENINTIRSDSLKRSIKLSTLIKLTTKKETAHKLPISGIGRRSHYRRCIYEEDNNGLLHEDSTDINVTY